MERYLDSSAWFAAGWNTSKYALIVSTDIAKYDLRSKEEPTQGAAAAAVLIAKDPKLLEIIPGAFGSALRHEKGDFKKPGGRTVALVDGVRSYASYLTEMKLAWLNFQKAAIRAGMAKQAGDHATIDGIDRAIYHNPHKKMVISAYASLLMHEWRTLPRWKDVISSIGQEPSREGMDDLTYYMSEPYQDFRRKFMNSKAFVDDFARRVGSSVLAPELVGNSYSVSVFVGLDSLFENDKEELGRKKVVLCGYGSGSHAVIQANVVPDGFREVSKKFDLMSRLNSRKKLSIEEYEKIHSGTMAPSEWPSGTSKRFVLNSIGQMGTRAEGDREYTLGT
jgi:hydroxymethylglutaryl-CoA synthase